MTFGETIRQLREAKGLLLRQVAAGADMDTALLSKIERGERKALKEQVDKIAILLSIEEKELTTIWLTDKILELIKGFPVADIALENALKELRRK